LSRQVSFEGYVSEEHLAQLYHQSDVLLAPSLYESFGTFYLEAMQAGLPVITFENGGACEIFAQQQDDGAILVPSGDIAAFVQAADHILTDPALRRRIGLNGQRRYHAAFTSDKMAAATIQFYHKVLEAHKPRQSAQQPIYQVMEALDVGDAVSGITQVSASMLGQLGQPDIILSRYSHNALRHKTRPLHTAVETPDCSLIFHYWNYNSSTWLLNAVRGRKAIYYHNVTPPSFFASDSTTYRNMMRGYRQMFEIADHFDLIIGVSRYNIHEFLRFTTRTVPTIPIYPVVERNALHKTPYDNRLYDQLSKKHHTNIVFIGRIVRNKRQDQLIRLFDYYYRVVNNHATLWLIGNEGSDPEYRAELEQLRRSLRSSHQIVFTGKVDDDALFAYLRAAHLFVCASEHEGFCVPIVQAMAFDIPVLAYATSAIPETMGQSGLLLQEWDIPRIAELMHLARTDSRFRRNIQLGQRKNMQRFTSNEAYNRLHAVVRYLQDQTPDTLFEYPQREYPTSVPFLGDTIGLNQ
jgi:glycosyltransferase involved in cell wall biosynthesis